MDNGTIKEICDVVTREVMKQVQSNLSDMKPELIRSVTEAAARQAVAAAEQSADNRCKRLEQRIAQLESAFQSVKSRCDGLEKHAELLESRIAKLTATPPVPAQPKAERIPARAVDGVTTLSSAQIEEILSYSKLSIQKDGWIYYYKIHNGEYSSDSYAEIFKVRSDGTQNQKIFNGKAHYLYTHYFELSGNMLHFMDSEGQERAIRIQ